jgi:transcriptional regulator NrdR family protein
MKCPYCNSENYKYLKAEYDTQNAILMFECIDCKRKFDGIYSFLYFEDENGNTLGTGY